VNLGYDHHLTGISKTKFVIRVTIHITTLCSILFNMFEIPRIEFIDYMKLKKKEDQTVDALVFFGRGNKYSREEIWSQSAEQRLKEKSYRDFPIW